MLGFAKQPRLMAAAQRGRRRHMRAQVADPELRAQAHARLHARLQAGPDLQRLLPGARQAERRAGHRGRRRGARATRSSAPTATEREVDAIIFGTGFDVTDIPGPRVIHGRDGRSLDRDLARQPARLPRHDGRRLPELLHARRAELGTRAQSDGRHDRVAVSRTCWTRSPDDAQGSPASRSGAEVQDRFIAEIDRKMKRTVWTHGGCDELVHRRDRPQLDALARLDVRHAKATGVSTSPSTRSSGPPIEFPAPTARLIGERNPALGEGFPA